MTVQNRDWDPFITAASDGGQHLDFAIDGIYCAGCMARIERGLKSLPGITRARLNLTTKRLAVDWDPAAAEPSQIVGRLAMLGYTAHPFDPGNRDAAEDAETRRLLRCLAVAGFAGMNVMLLSVSVWSGNVTDITPETRSFFHWLSALIALPTAIYAGRPFYESAWRALKAKSLNMDVPIAIGVTLALLLSVYQTLVGAEDTYFDSALMLMFFLLVGRYLDRNMRRRTRSHAENLTALRGETAARICEDGTVSDVPVSLVQAGELVLARPGERIAVDGVIELGSGDIDQSLVTGETKPEPAGPGDQVYAGTMNMAATLRIRVNAGASDTLLFEVNRLLEAATEAKSKYLHLADRAAQLYAPLVHAAAALTFIGWVLAGLTWDAALVTAISVLIITCPCALGLAIPAVQVVASGLMFKRGILLHGGEAIERLAEVDHVVFDKTGTLTLPDPNLVAIDGLPDADRIIAGGLAASSRHPLAQALARALDADQPLAGVTEHAGEGVEVVEGGIALRLGSPTFCHVDADRLSLMTDQYREASFIAFQMGEGRPAVFVLRQVLRPMVGDTLALLREAGLAISILSGDRENAVRPIAEELAISTYQSGLAPAQKIAHIEKLKADGSKVLMVGDGLNDAPALAAAHVSMSPVSAVHLAQSAADAVFMGQSLRPVADAVTIAKRARSAMVQNLALAAAYNMLAVPFAVAGFVTPLTAAIAMSASSLIVTANALRLRLTRQAGETAESETPSAVANPLPAE